MIIKLNCLGCGHSMELGDAYEDYEGEVRCWGCGAALDVVLCEGKLRSMRMNDGTLANQKDAGSLPVRSPIFESATSAADRETR